MYGFAVIVFLAALANLQLVIGQQKAIRRPNKYDKIVVVKGIVNIIDHPTLGRTPCRNCRLAFERVDCPDSFVLITTDDSGEYRLGLGKGKYRLVSDDVTPDGIVKSLLAPGQRDILDLRTIKGTLEFNIEIALGPG